MAVFFYPTLEFFYYQVLRVLRLSKKTLFALNWSGLKYILVELSNYSTQLQNNYFDLQDSILA